jgi:hypothetical protein
MPAPAEEHWYELLGTRVSVRCDDASARERLAHCYATARAEPAADALVARLRREHGAFRIEIDGREPTTAANNSAELDRWPNQPPGRVSPGSRANPAPGAHSGSIATLELALQFLF